MNNYLFLDIDGVLNSVEYSEECNRLVLSSWVKANLDEGIDANPMFNPESVNVLRAIQEAYNFKIVISSTWRYHLDVQDFHKIFKTYYEWDTTDIIIGKTDKESGIRGEQIQRWLDCHGKYPYNYLIVDDSSDMLESQMPKFLHVNLLKGLQDFHIDEVIEILGY